MPRAFKKCPLETKSNGVFKREHVYPCSLSRSARVKRRESTDCTQILITKSHIKLRISAVRIYLPALYLV